MKKAILLTAALALLISRPVKAEVITEKVWATGYNVTGTTATGTWTTEGVTVAGKREWLGKTMMIWKDDGDGKIKASNYIGMYSVDDTGGQTIQEGSVIDIYFSDYQEAVNFGSEKVIIQLIEAEG